MTKKQNKETSSDDLIDALLEKHGISPEAVLGENGLIAQLKKRVVERALAGELTHHLGYAKGEAPEEVENHRNGYSKKTVVGEDGAMEIEVPRRLWRVAAHYVEAAHAKNSWAKVRAISVDGTSARRGHPAAAGPMCSTAN
jgi:hypothetical protein